MPHKIAIVGLGKITEDQHIPVIRKNPAFELVAVASQRGLTVEGVEHSFRDWRDLLARTPGLEIVAVCTPPQARYAVARAALDAGKHVLLEKPPTATVGELLDLKRTAEHAGLVLFQTWHSRYNAAVTQAKLMLDGQSVQRLAVNWKEDVRHWHPDQKWIWEPGGYGVFDPGINALSIVTRIMPEPVFVKSAELFFPANRASPIAARLALTSHTAREDWSADFDWRQKGGETWDIDIETTDGLVLRLSLGGSRLESGGSLVIEEKSQEYEQIYERFDDLLKRGRSEVDEAPLRLVADAFLAGSRNLVEDFLD